MELPQEIQKKIWCEVRILRQKDKYNKVVNELKLFVENQRRKKYYISNLDYNDESIFMYLNFTLDLILDNSEQITRTGMLHKSYSWYMWSLYLDRCSVFIEPIREPSLKIALDNFTWNIYCCSRRIYDYLSGIPENPEIYGYYFDQYY